MSSTTSLSLHRLHHRRALETTPYGYEVPAHPATVSDCLQTIQWIDCWCPDTAQFILFDAPDKLSARDCPLLLRALEACHLGCKLRLVCRRSTLDDRVLVDALYRGGLGVLLDIHDASDLDDLEHLGVIALRLGPAAIAAATSTGDELRASEVVRTAQELGMRVVASQMPRIVDERHLFALGFDYVSQDFDAVRPVGPNDIMRKSRRTA